MSSNENNLDSSMESALNMSQDEIEKLLNGYAEEANDKTFDFEGEDLASLLSELEAGDDEDIQEISDLLNKAENNEAADEGIEELMRIQEQVDDIPAYEAADLFSSNESKGPKKKGFIQKLIDKFKKPSTDKPVKEEAQENIVEAPTDSIQEAEELIVEKPQRNKKEKKVKEKKVKEKKSKKEKKNIQEESEQGQQEWDNIDVFQASEEALNGSDAIIYELEKDEIAKQEELDSIKSKKEKKSKKKKESKKAVSSEEGENSEGKEKKKKDKKVKEKKVKEKKVKIKTVDITDVDISEPVSKKKTAGIFFVCIMLMFALVAIIVNYSGHANRRLAEEAYNSGDYLECYQMLYGQHMDESQEVMFHKSEIILKMDLFWNRYENYTRENNLLEGLNKLVQFVFEYPDMREYASEWNCEKVVEETYVNVLNELYEEYRLEEQEAINIADIESDIDYTKTLTDLVEKKQQGLLLYPNMLPEEEERVIEQNQ